MKERGISKKVQLERSHISVIVQGLAASSLLLINSFQGGSIRLDLQVENVNRKATKLGNKCQRSRLFFEWLTAAVDLSEGLVCVHRRGLCGCRSVEL